MAMESQLLDLIADAATAFRPLLNPEFFSLELSRLLFKISVSGMRRCSGARTENRVRTFEALRKLGMKPALGDVMRERVRVI
jgi:hypothetical protein